MSATPESLADDRAARSDDDRRDEPTTDTARRIGRRPFLKGCMVTAGAIAGGATYGTRDAEAIAPAVWAVGTGVSIAAGWALREFEIIGSDSPAEGMTADALQQKAYELMRSRESSNKSTFVDNRNLIPGAANSAYTDAKVEAIESLNTGASQSDVQAAGEAAIDSAESTIKRNVIRSWNESVQELINIADQIQAHSDMTLSESMTWQRGDAGDNYTIDGLEIRETASDLYPDYPSSHDQTYTLPDGTTQDHYFLAVPGSENAGMSIEHQAASSSYTDNPDQNRYGPVLNSDPAVNADLDWSGDFDGWAQPLQWTDWYQLWQAIETEFSDVRDSFILWVDNVYSQVQSGEIELSELITPRERAEMMADEESLAPAIADLIALNVNVDPDREATITLDAEDVTLRGTFARTDNPQGEPIESGMTYDPETDLTGDVYFTYSVSGGEGTWTDYETGVDGGTITFTAEPKEGVQYVVETTAGETAEVEATAFADNGDGTYSTDVSSQLDNNITEISSVTFYNSGDDGYETVLLEQPFTVEKFEDSEGNEVEQASFSQSSEPQTDSNYITQEEWDELAAQNEELIEKYENSQGGGGITIPGFGEIPPLGIGAVILGVIALLAGTN